MAQYGQDCRCGTRWFPDRDSAFLLNAATTAWGMVLDPATTDEIASIWPVFCAAFADRNCVAVEVFNYPLEEQDELLTQSFYPTGDLFDNQAFGWGPYSSFQVQAVDGDGFEFIDETSLTPGVWPDTGRATPNNEFLCAPLGQGFEYSFQVGSIAGTFSGNWITRVKLVWDAARFAAEFVQSAATWTPYLLWDGKRYFGPPVTKSDDLPVTVETVWWANPATGVPWTCADMDAFDDSSGETTGFGWLVQGTGEAQSYATILAAHVEVEYATTDQRLAVGAVCIDPPQGWQEIALVSPDDGAAETVTLAPPQEVLWSFRQTVAEPGGFSCALCHLDAPGEPLEGTPSWLSVPVDIDLVSHRVRSTGTEGSVLMGLGLETTVGGVYSADSQVYATTSPEGLDKRDAWPQIDAYFRMSPVDETHSIYQQFTPPTTAEYAWLDINVCSATGQSDGALRVSIRDEATHSDLITPVEIELADLEPAVTRWQTLGVMLDVGNRPTLTAGTRYYFAVESTASHRYGWLVQVANGGMQTGPPQGPPTGMFDVSYGGDETPPNRLILQVDGVNTAWPASTAEVAISILPDAPTDLAAVANDDDCGNPYVDLTWVNPTISADCGGFLYTTVERSDDDGATWDPICRITDEMVEAFEDWEVIAGNPTIYRARTVRGDGVPSDWTDNTDPVTTGQIECGLSFTSNEQPDLRVWYPDISGPRQFNWPRDETTFAPFDRDAQVVFSELPDRGTVFTVELKIRAGDVNYLGQPCFPGCDDVTLTGEAVFDPVKAIATADLSYVCVRDEAGDRWFAHLRVPSGVWDPATNTWTVEAEITEVTFTPSTPDSSAGS